MVGLSKKPATVPTVPMTARTIRAAPIPAKMQATSFSVPLP